MCGITGAIGPDINPVVFKMLMIEGDIYGGHTAGIFQHGKSDTFYYALPETSDWLLDGLDPLEGYGQPPNVIQGDKTRNFLGKIPFQENPTVILSHARKTIVGSNDLINAHPLEAGNLIVLHNGTVNNFESLAEKHGINMSPNESDSVFVARMLTANKLTELVEEYKGQLTIVWMNKNHPNTISVFCGYDKLKAEPVIARPLYYLQIEDSIYISRSFTALDKWSVILYDGKHFVKVFPGNREIRIKDNKVKIVRAFEHKPPQLRPATFEPHSQLPFYEQSFGPSAGFKPERLRRSESLFTKMLFSETSKNPLKLCWTGGLYHIGGKLFTTSYYRNKLGEIVFLVDTYVDEIGNVYIKDAADGFYDWDYNPVKHNVNLYQVYAFKGILYYSEEDCKYVISRDDLPEAPMSVNALHPIPKSLAYARIGFFYSGGKVANGTYMVPFSQMEIKIDNGYLTSAQYKKRKMSRGAWKKILNEYCKRYYYEQSTASVLKAGVPV